MGDCATSRVPGHCAHAVSGPATLQRIRGVHAFSYRFPICVVFIALMSSISCGLCQVIAGMALALATGLGLLLLALTTTEVLAGRVFTAERPFSPLVVMQVTWLHLRYRR